jgi:hypothetical protein
LAHLLLPDTQSKPHAKAKEPNAIAPLDYKYIVIILRPNNTLSMDTDDLSQEAYKAIIIEAERFNHDLTLRFGLLSGECDDEEKYLNKSLQLIEKLKNAKKYQLEDIFFGNLPNTDKLNKTLDRITENIANVKKIPFNKRHFDF